MVYDFITIDFETSNINYNSACSIGIVAVKDNKICDEFYSLIKPPSMGFDIKSMEINKITPEDVKNSPTFPDVWDKIKHYFNKENIIVAHNAIFDMNVLKNCLKEYNLEIPDFNYLCSIPISTRACRGENIGKSLKDRCIHFGVPLENHHNALDDAKTCANLVLCILSKTRRKSFKTFCSTYSSLPLKSFLELKENQFFTTSRGPKFNKINVSDIVPTIDNIDTSSPFYNKNVVFTGELSYISRKDAMHNVVNLGGILKSGISKSTHYLIVGTQDKSIVGGAGLSGKEQKALKLQKEGQNIIIIDEDTFKNIIN